MKYRRVLGQRRRRSSSPPAAATAAVDAPASTRSASLRRSYLHQFALRWLPIERTNPVPSTTTTTADIEEHCCEYIRMGHGNMD